MLNISSPWVTYYRKLEALFGEDPDIMVDFEYDENESPVVKLYVTGADKAEALAKILPVERTFGNVTVNTIIVPSNREETKADVFVKAFTGNPAFSYGVTVDNPFVHGVGYVVFRNKVVQFFNDDISDVNGFETTLYENIADDVFGDNAGVFFCTDTPSNTGVPVSMVV